MMIGPKWEMPRRASRLFTTGITRDQRVQDATRANRGDMAYCLDAHNFQQRTLIRYATGEADR